MTARQPVSIPASNSAVSGVSAASSPAVTLKGRMMMVSVMRVATTDRNELDQALSQRFSEAPELLRDMPMVLDIEGLALSNLAEAMVVIEHIRRHGFKLIGLRRSPGLSSDLVDASGLPEIVVDSSQSARSERVDVGSPNTKNVAGAGMAGAMATEASLESPSEMADELTGTGNEVDRRAHRVSSPSDGMSAGELPGKAAAVDSGGLTSHTGTRLVLDHVRSGQQIYVRGGDLIIMGAVSPGAEVLADGHIMVHGALRGRALAGVRGMTDATIYCRRLDAELLAIAGNYRIAEDIQDSERGENRLVMLQGGRIYIREI